MITCYFGLPGVGKSTVLAMIAARENKRIKKGKSKYKRVFTNFPVVGCYQFSFSQLGLYDMSDSLILIDEITMDADNREFKSFPHYVRDAFILHRKRNQDIIYFTQNWNAVDKKIRDLTAELYYLNRLPFITVGTRIFRCQDINEQTKEIVFGYRFPNLWERIKSWIIPFYSIYVSCFRPLYYKYFDTFEAPVLPEHDFDIWKINTSKE